MAEKMDLDSEDWSPEAIFAEGVLGEFSMLQEELMRRREIYKAELNRGVAPGEFAKGQALLGAYDAATNGLNNAWRKRHGAV